MKTIKGIYRAGKIELSETPGGVNDNTRVIVTFLDSNVIELKACNIDKAETEELRRQLDTFSGEWDSVEMNIYDDYDAVKS